MTRGSKKKFRRKREKEGDEFSVTGSLVVGVTGLRLNYKC